MTTHSIQTAVLNSLLFIRDSGLKNFPHVDGEEGVWTTPSCIAVSCLPDSEGQTEVTIGASREVARTGHLLFNGFLETPSRTVIVEGVAADPLLKVQVAHARTRVLIWTNGHLDTDEVIIGID